jgi:hypothetical protein
MTPPLIKNKTTIFKTKKPPKLIKTTKCQTHF